MSTGLPAPREKHLQSLQEWFSRQRLPMGLLHEIIVQALIDGGCPRPDDAARYNRYLDGLLVGKHDISLLDSLSLPALQISGQVLVAWRAWLQLNALTPSILETIVLDCLAAIQSHTRPRELTSHDLDHTTGLPDRHALPAALARAQQHTEEGRLSALLYIEISSSAHAYPGAMLRILAQRLSAMLRNQDALLLLDRQTFGLVLANLNGEGHALLASNRALSCFSDAILMQDQQAVQLNPRIGIALAPQHGRTAKQLFEASATAARQSSSERIAIYDPKQNELSFALSRLEAPFREALEHNHFHLVFQPQIFNRKMGLYGLESLLRWENEQLGSVSPSHIVSVAEHLGLMGELTQWILNASLREFAKLVKIGVPGSVSINVAPSNLLDREFSSMLEDALALWEVPAQRVVLEVTESALIENQDAAFKAMQALRDMGCKMALDDFGTGYSSLSYLKRLPIDELKIDRSFILTMHESSKDAGIVRTIIELSHLLGLVVVTEGVEEAKTVRLLAEMGNDVIQGFFFSKPLRPEAIPAFFSAMKQWGKKSS